MPAIVRLKVLEGSPEGQEWVFADRTTCLIGRAADCAVRIPESNKQVSRHHCLLDINPPDIRIRDFGSLNGTIVNNQVIGKRAQHDAPGSGESNAGHECDLQHGDTLRLGQTTMQVEIVIPRSPAAASPRVGVRQCTACQRDVTSLVGARRYGDYICPNCQARPQDLAKQLLVQAKTGRRELASIEGYTIERELGRGGFGAVYLARHEHTQNQVALKLLLPSVAADPDAISRFMVEVENSLALQHPHIVKAHHGGCSAGVFFLTLEYCENGSVDKLQRQRGGTFSIAEASRIMLQVLDGLHYAHHALIPKVRLNDGTYRPGKGLVHRDLKPPNIFLDREGTAKIGDFGLAKAFDLAGLCGQTCTGQRAGTPRFMPREQARDFKCSKPEVDVWAAAASLYFMLTNHAPRPSKKRYDVWDNMFRSDALPIRQRAPEIPARLAEVIDAALVEEPRIGFQTAAEFKRALERVL